MMRDLDIATLRSLQAVAEYGAVTRAAEALNMTQSAMSMQIKRLEQVFDRPLLEKAGRGVVLSDFALALLEESRKLVARNDAILARFTGIRPRGRLRLGISSNSLTITVPRAVRAFRAEHPQIEFVVTNLPTRDLLVQFDRGDQDVILTTEFSCPDRAEHLCKVDLSWQGAIGGTAWHQRPLPFSQSSVCAYRSIGVAALERAGIEWFAVSDGGGGETESVMTRADLGVSIHPHGFAVVGIEPVDHGGALPPLPPTWINMYLTDGPAAGIARDFGCYLRRAMDEMPQSVLAAAG